MFNLCADIKNALMSCQEATENKEAFQTDAELFFKNVCILSDLKNPRVTFYGGSALGSGKYYDSAKLLAQKLVDNDFILVSGGGSSIMEAANCGAQNAKNNNLIKSIAISAEGFEFNKCADIKLMHKYFFFRKLLLYSSDYAVFFPGGYGTLDELSEILTLMEINRRKKIPVILFGKKFWSPLVSWLENAFDMDHVPTEFRNLICVVDSVDEAFKLIIKQYKDSRRLNEK